VLIPSPRHTPADLALWAELESADRVHGGRLMRSGRVERSVAAIREFAGRGPCYASVSWGKDSVALAHMIMESCPSIPLVHLRAVPHGNPENGAVRDPFLAASPSADYREIAVDYRDIPAGSGADAVEREKDRRFFGAFTSLGLSRHLSGIRADESSGRKVRMRRFGLASPNACAPMGWWSAADVFGYLAVNGLPVHPSYAMLGGGRWDRRHVRVDELGGARGDQFGRRAWEIEYYGDVLRRLEVTPRT
jgi:phosphoadenosine phosphosulfate reductase